jgi:hypothetical protein
LLTILQISLSWTSSPSSMPMVCMFGLSVESQGSCVFPFQLSLPKDSSVFHVSILSLSPEGNLSSIFSCLLNSPSTVFS